MTFPAALLDPAPVNVPPRKTTAEDEANIAKIIEHFNRPDFDLPVTEPDPEHRNISEEKRAPLSEREMMYLSRETILRFLSATKTGVAATIDRLERAIVWRRSVHIEDVAGLAKENEEEAAMGKTIVMGYAPNGSPIMYFFPHRNCLPANSANRKLVHALFMLERAGDLMSDGATQVLVVFNFGGKRKGPQTSVQHARETLNILGDYYPELLGHAIIQEMPWVIRAFVAIMWPFVDPHTKSKIKFYSGEEAVAAGAVDGNTFLKECGGRMDLRHDGKSYWPTLIETCLARRAEHERLWRSLGEPRVGREERLFKVARPLAVEL